jgi:hypothetical protein
MWLSVHHPEAAARQRHDDVVALHFDVKVVPVRHTPILAQKGPARGLLRRQRVEGTVGMARRRQPNLTNGKIDPRRVDIALDAMVLDRKSTPRDALVERLLTLEDEGTLNIRQPAVAHRQMQHPNTPSSIRERMSGAIHTQPTSLTSDEQRCYDQVVAALRGNSPTDRHDADAAIVFDLKKYGGYLVTEDRRILKLREELQAIPSPAQLWIVTLEEFFAIYDTFVETRSISGRA